MFRVSQRTRQCRSTAKTRRDFGQFVDNGHGSLGGRLCNSKRSFAAFPKFIIDADGLRDAQIPRVVRCGGTAIGPLAGDTRPNLAERRNILAHGDPFEGLPAGGLLERVRDLIDFAYRDDITEAPKSELSA